MREDEEESNSQESNDGLSIGPDNLESCTGKTTESLFIVGAFTYLSSGY